MVIILSIDALSKYFGMERYDTVIIWYKHFCGELIWFGKIIGW